MTSFWWNPQGLPDQNINQIQAKHGVEHFITTQELPVHVQTRSLPPKKNQSLPNLRSIDWRTLALYFVPWVSGNHCCTCMVPKHLVVGSHVETTNISIIPQFLTCILYLRCKIFSLTLTVCTPFLRLTSFKVTMNFLWPPKISKPIWTDWQHVGLLRNHTPWLLYEQLFLEWVPKNHFWPENAVQTFQHLMDSICRWLEFTYGYIDDILVAIRDT